MSSSSLDIIMDIDRQAREAHRLWSALELLKYRLAFQRGYSKPQLEGAGVHVDHDTWERCRNLYRK